MSERHRGLIGVVASVLAIVACAVPPVVPAVEQVSIDAGGRSVEVGGTLSLSVTVVAVGGAIEAVVWDTDDPAVATVSSMGVVSGVAPGVVSVSATSVFDPTKSDAVSVTVDEANTLPVAAFDAEPAFAFSPARVRFDASGSFDLDGDALEFRWAFGDGSTGVGVAPVHEYASDGTYTAALTVDDGRGGEATTTTSIVVGPFMGAVPVATPASSMDAYNRHWLAHDGDTALVAASTGGYYTHVNVFTRTAPGAWSFTTTLTPTTGSDAYRDIGRAVQLSGSVAAVLSQRRVSSTPEVWESVVHIFERNASGDWTQEAALLRGDGIGTALTTGASIAIALRDDVLVVGLPSYSAYASVVRVYTRDAGGVGAWGMAQEIPFPASAPDYAPVAFGSDVAVGADGNVIVVAQSDQNNDGGLGSVAEAAYIYERTAAGTDDWALVHEIRRPDLPSPYSTYVETDGSAIAITAMPTVISAETDVAVFERDQGGAGAWGNVARYHVEAPVDAGFYCGMGHSSIRLVGDVLAVGIMCFGCGSADPIPPGTVCSTGQVHLYGRDVGGEGAWGEAQVLTLSDPAYRQGLGHAVDIDSDGRTVLAASRMGASSVVYAFER
jgi:PKD repeat protein